LYLHKDSLVLQYHKSKSPAIREKILLSYKPLVDYIARKLAFNKEDVDDLIQVGTIGLLRSLDRFDSSKDIDFSTFATPNVIGEIKHYFRDKSRLVKVPRKLQEMYSKIKTYIRQAQKDGEHPTVEQISKALDIPEDRILECMEIGQSSLVVSLDAPSYKSDSVRRSDSATPSILDSIGIDGEEDQLLQKEMIQQALDQLDERERKIIELRFYIGLSQMEIAKRLNLSQMHISRLLTKSISHLRKVLEPS